MLTEDHPAEAAQPVSLPLGRPLRVLHVTETTISGVKRHLLDLLAGLAGRDDVIVEVACPALREDHGGDTSFVADAQALGVRVHVVPMRRSIRPHQDLLSVLRLARVIRQGRYDVVHLHSSKAGAFGRVAARLASLGTPGPRPRVIYTPNGWSFLIPGSRARSLAYATVERLLGRLTDRVIVVSEDERAQALSQSIIPFDRTRLVRSGITPSALPGPDAAERKRQEMGWDEHGRTVVVGTVARLTLQKDPSTWLRAVAQAAPQCPDTRFVWIGHGELEPEFLALAEELGLSKSPQFHYLGYRHDARELIAALDVFTLSSVFEGLSYVLMEAMAVGRPIAATAGISTGELVKDGVTGLLAPPGDPDALAERMVRLVRDADLRTRFGHAGRELVLECCTTARQVAQTERVYYEALGYPPAPDGSTASTS